MTPRTWCVVGALVTVLIGHGSWADPSKSATYKHAKEAYDRKDYATAELLLHRYLAEDRAFLVKNPNIAGQINKAVAFCDSLVQSESIASVSDALDADQPASATPPPPSTPPPPLP